MINNRNDYVDLREWQEVRPDYLISSYNNIACDNKFKELSQKLHLESRTLLSVREMWNIYNCVIKTEKIFGDIAEVGVYQGGSAKLICETKNKKLHLFDTFGGIPETGSNDGKIQKGSFSANLNSVKMYLDRYDDLYFYQGIFPKSTENYAEKLKTFSFVHLDVDTYSSTLDSLHYFYNKMSIGAIILTHDYRCIHCPGVRKAFDEFFYDKPETIIELWDTQALIVKL
jgi:hypothetical protein